MTIQTTLLDQVAQTLQIPEEELLRQGLTAYLERQLRMVKAEIFELYGRYHIASVQEMEARYKDGTLEEANSWQDFKRLDHLEYKRDQLQQLLENVG
ncbi:MAG: hypothetical protein ACE5FD_09060 [Anaerolineae bacterium]